MTDLILAEVAGQAPTNVAACLTVLAVVVLFWKLWR